MATADPAISRRPTPASSPSDGFLSTSDVNAGEDRISCLPSELLSNIVTRLPLKEAARTSTLSRPWRLRDSSPDNGILCASSPSDGSLSTSDVNAGEDRISCLPSELLSNIVTRLPLKEAARTSTLSRPWRLRASSPDKDGILCASSPSDGSLSTSDVNAGEDRISCLLVTRLPLRPWRLRASSPDKDGILCAFSPSDGSLSTSDVNAREDRISCLPSELLSSIVARLPIKDAARTAVLSPRWRRVWTGSLTTSDINGGEDRISRLPDKLLYNIVTRLPLKDAARTSTLSPRWRRVWASTPLVLCDADLFPALSDGGGFVSRTVTDTISCILTVHQGPFRSICLTYSFHRAVAHDAALACRWLRLLADKGVESLELFNHPSSIFGSTSTSLPSEVLLVASLVRLSLRHWDFPSTDCLRRAAYVFPRLRELYLCDIHIGAMDIDRLLQYSPELEIFALIDSKCMPPNVCIRNCNLQCVIFWMSVANMFEVLAGPSLERLIVWCTKPDGHPIHDSPIQLSIGYTQKLKVLGYLDPRIHVLEVGSTVIKADTRPRTSSVAPSVRILALNVRFDVPKEAQMVPSFLGCFPYLHTLHVQSGGGDEPIGEPNFKFWLEASAIKCLKSTLRKVVVKNFRGYASEFSFLKFIWERAKVLQKLVVDLASGDDPALVEEIFTKLKSEVCVKRVKGRKSMFMLRSGGSKWCLNIASNLTLSDPFDF